MNFMGVDRAAKSDGTSPLTTGIATTVVYSRTFKISSSKYFGAWLKAASSGAVKLVVELEQSYRDLTEDEQGSANSDYVVPDGASEVYADLTDTDAHVVAVTPKTMPYGRLKVTAGTGNDASTTLDFQLVKQG